MRQIEKKIVTDEAGQPVAVQIDYADWLTIERQLDIDSPDESTKKEPSLEELAEAVRPHWKGGDGLEYQRRIRAEWDRDGDEAASK